jgi:hypothetical protein
MGFNPTASSFSLAKEECTDRFSNFLSEEELSMEEI